MLFRSCDEECEGSIKAEDFRMFLSKVKLGLGQGMINMIVKIFDEDCSGLIKREDYNETL